MCCTKHWLKCLHERFASSAWPSTLCGCPFFDFLFLALVLSVCLSYPFFFYLDTDLYLFLHVDLVGAISHWHSPTEESGTLAENTPLIVSVVFAIGFIGFSCAPHTHFCFIGDPALSLLFCARLLCSSEQAMESPSSSVSTGIALSRAE